MTEQRLGTSTYVRLEDLRLYRQLIVDSLRCRCSRTKRRALVRKLKALDTLVDHRLGSRRN